MQKVSEDVITIPVVLSSAGVYAFFRPLHVAPRNAIRGSRVPAHSLERENLWVGVGEGASRS